MPTIRGGKIWWAFGTMEVAADTIHLVQVGTTYEVHDADHQKVAVVALPLEGVEVRPA